jgi:branched-chain amino acid transport system substrate-binding protein
VGGRAIRILSADHQLKPDVGAQIARRWYDVDKVNLIVDVPVSAVGLAVQSVAAEKHKLFITNGTLATDFTGRFCSRYTMQWTFDTTALANGTARAITQRGGKRWFFLTADYAFGISLERDAAKVVQENGGTVLGEVRHPFNASDLTSFVVQAQGSGADIIGLANGPPDNMTAIKTGAEFGLAAHGQSMAGLFVVISDIHGLGLQAAQGLLLTTSFYWDMDEQTRAWSRRFFERTHRMPTMVQASVYSGVAHYLNAVKASGSDDPDRVSDMMRQTPVNDFFSRNGTLRIDGLMVHDLYLAQVKAPQESKAPWDYYRILTTIPGKEAFPTLEAGGCALATGATKQ